MKPTLQLTPQELTLYQDREEFQKFYRLKLELADIFNEYIDGEAAKYGYNVVNEVMEKELLPYFEEHFANFKNMMDLQIRYPESGGIH